MPKQNTALFKSTFYEAVKQFATSGKRLRKGCSYLSNFIIQFKTISFFYIYIAPKSQNLKAVYYLKLKTPQ